MLSRAGYRKTELAENQSKSNSLGRSGPSVSAAYQHHSIHTAKPTQTPLMPKGTREPADASVKPWKQVMGTNHENKPSKSVKPLTDVSPIIRN